MVTVKWRGREVEISEAEWRACKRAENGAAAIGLLAAGALFVGGLTVGGLQQIGVVAAILVGLGYFDGYLSRFCASRKAARG